MCVQAEPIRVVVTGAAGQIAYSLLYSIAKGDVFGKDQVRLSSGCISCSRPALWHLAAARLHNGLAMNKAWPCLRDASMPSEGSSAPTQGFCSKVENGETKTNVFCCQGRQCSSAIARTTSNSPQYFFCSLKVFMPVCPGAQLDFGCVSLLLLVFFVFLSMKVAFKLF